MTTHVKGKAIRHLVNKVEESLQNPDNNSVDSFSFSSEDNQNDTK
jgi:hypothetical protein